MYQLQDVSLTMSEFNGMIDIAYVLLVTIAKKWSTHSVSYLL